MRRMFRSDWMVRNGAVNKAVNVVVTPAVVVSNDDCYINNLDYLSSNNLREKFKDISTAAQLKVQSWKTKECQELR